MALYDVLLNGGLKHFREFMEEHGWHGVREQYLALWCFEDCVAMDWRAKRSSRENM